MVMQNNHTAIFELVVDSGKEIAILTLKLFDIAYFVTSDVLITSTPVVKLNVFTNA
jgi:hypothetical protein